MPFQPARIQEGPAAGGGNFLVAAMYTPSHAGLAGRLRESCEQFGVPYVLHEVPAVHNSVSVKGSPDPAFTKPNYIRTLIEQYRKPVLYLDADCVFRAFPVLAEELAGNGTAFAIYNWLADADNDAFYPIDLRLKGRVIQDRYFIHSHRVGLHSAEQLVCSGCAQFYGTSPAAAALLALWHDTIVQHPQAADDKCLDFAFNNGGAGLPGLRWSWLPKEYARYCWWILNRPVIDHPQFPSIAPGFKDILPDSGRRHVHLDRCTPTPARFPQRAVIDVVDKQLYEFDQDWLSPLGPLVQECWVAEGNRTTAIIDIAGIDTSGAQVKQGG